MEQDDENTLDVRERDSADDLDVFSVIVSAMKRLSPDARLRMLRSVATFLDLPITSKQSGTSLERAIGTAPSSGTQAAFSEDRSPTPKQFMFEKKPVTDVERVACLAYYLSNYRGTPHFKTLDISKLNTEAAQIKFGNAAQAVDNASKAGLLVAAAKGTKQLSAGGELYVEALPDRAAAKSAIAHARPRRQRNRGRVSESKNGELESEVGDSA